MRKIFFSIITPTLNQGKYISETIQSVKEQNYPFLEHLIIDGGSQDNTRKILSQSKTITWYKEIEKNQSESINLGWKIAKGDILGWLNSDDLYEPNVFVTIANFFQQHHEVDMIYGDCNYINEGGDSLGSYPTQSFNLPNLIRYATNYIPQPAVFMRRSVLESVGFLNESLNYAMDFEYWMRAGLSQKTIYLPIRLAKMRLHSRAKSIRKLGEFANELSSIYEHYFTQENLREDIKQLQNISMHNVYTRAAHISFWANNPSSSFKNSLKALTYHSANPKTLLYLLASNKITCYIANRTRKNPYAP